MAGVVPVEVGNMRHCIQLQKPKAVSDKRNPDGSFSDDYENDIELFAEKNPTRGRQVYPADRADEETFLRFRIWAIDDINPSWRAIFEGQVYNIKALFPDNDNKYMILEMVLPEEEPTGDN